MPLDLPNHNDPITYDRGKWVPVGWKPLNTTARTRQLILQGIAKRRSEAFDKESQRDIIRKRKKEKAAMKNRAVDEVNRLEQEVQDCLQKKEELLNLKHEQFVKLKTVFQREHFIKKALEEKKRNEAALNQLLNPSYAQSLKQQTVHSNSLISQQFLTPQAQQFSISQNPSIQNITSLQQQALLQSLHTNKPQFPSATKPQAVPHIGIHNSQSLTQPSQIRSGMIPPAAQSPFYSNSNYASPASSRNFPPPNVNSPRRDRPPMASPKLPQPQSRHNSFVGGSRPDLVRASETSSPAIPVTNPLGMTNLDLQTIQALARQAGYPDINRLVLPQHQATPPPQGGIRR